MSGPRCEREDELLDALSHGYIGAELDAHVEGCLSCGELHLVASAFLDDRREAIVEATVPSAGTTWWRIQLRRRQEMQAAARRSLLIGQAMTLVVALTLIAAIFGDELVAGVRQSIASLHLGTPVLLAIASWLLIAPIAGWVAIRQK